MSSRITSPRQAALTLPAGAPEFSSSSAGCLPLATERPIADPLRHFEDEEDRRRMQQNLAAAIVIVLLITSGFWLIDHLRASARIAACVEAGHHNCVPLDLDRDTGRR